MRIRMGHRGQEEWLFRGICEAKKEKNSIGFSSNLKMEMISFFAAQRRGGGGITHPGGGGGIFF